MTKGFPIPPNRIAKRGFHGTDFDFTGEVLPNRDTGNSHFGFSGTDDTYFVPGDNPANEGAAWIWSRSRDALASPRTGGRPRVHLTEPDPRQNIDANLHGHSVPFAPEAYDTFARVTPRQRILDTMWAPPPKRATEDSGFVSETHVEQTLPHINWRQMGLPNWKTHNVFGGVMDDQGLPLENESRYKPASRLQAFAASRNKHRPEPQIRGQLELPGTEYTKPRRGVF